MIKRIEKIATFLLILSLVGIFIGWNLSEMAESYTVTATVGTMVSCTTPATSTSFGTIDHTEVYTSSPNVTTTVNSNTSVLVKVYDVGDPSTTTKPGLYKSTSPTAIIGSADDSFADEATLQPGVSGYGIQATTTGPNLVIAPRFNKTGDNVGGLEASSTNAVLLASSSQPVSGEVITVIHKAATSATKPAGDYSDTITYICSSTP
jgi:hypothetical protein